MLLDLQCVLWFPCSCTITITSKPTVWHDGLLQLFLSLPRFDGERTVDRTEQMYVYMYVHSKSLFYIMKL